MIPQTNSDTIDIIELSSRTYKLNLEDEHIREYVDEKEAVIQSIHKILDTDRYSYLIYSWDYGFEVLDLIGEPLSYIIPELKRRIVEALNQDDRIKKVYNFNFKKIDKESLLVSFNIETKFGDLKFNKSLEVL